MKLVIHGLVRKRIYVSIIYTPGGWGWGPGGGGGGCGPEGGEGGGG